MEMHTNRVAPSVQRCTIPGEIVFWMATLFNCIAGGRVAKSPENPPMKSLTNSHASHERLFLMSALEFGASSSSFYCDSWSKTLGHFLQILLPMAVNHAE